MSKWGINILCLLLKDMYRHLKGFGLLTLFIKLFFVNYHPASHKLQSMRRLTHFNELLWSRVQNSKHYEPQLIFSPTVFYVAYIAKSSFGVAFSNKSQALFIILSHAVTTNDIVYYRFFKSWFCHIYCCLHFLKFI